MTDPRRTLADALPADPDDHGPIAVPSDAVRAVLAERERVTAGLAHHLDAGRDPCQDRGVHWPCDVAHALGVPDPDGGA